MISRSRVTLPQWFRYLAGSALLGFVYYGSARLGLRYASIGQSISLVWPPTGIAIAALTMLEIRYWPAIAIAALLANAATSVPLTTVFAIATGNTLEALVAASLLRRTTGSRPQLDNIRQVRTFLLTAAPLGALCSALVGSCSLWLSGLIPTSAVPIALVIWWTGDLLGALVVAPLVFAWSIPWGHTSPADWPRWYCYVWGPSPRARSGLAAPSGGPVPAQVQYLYLLFPFVVWAALRFGARGASLMTLTLAAAAVGHTVAGEGPFVSATSTRTLLGVTSYLVVVSVTGLVLAAAVRLERDHATAALADSEKRLRRALDAARMGVWVWSVENDTLVWDDNLRRLYGLDSGERISSYEDFLARVHPDDRELVGKTVRRALEAGEISIMSSGLSCLTVPFAGSPIMGKFTAPSRASPST